MNIYEKHFDNKVKEIFKTYSKEDVQAFETLLNFTSPIYNRSYFSKFENFLSIIGIGMRVDTVINEKTDKTIGYIPHITYRPNNFLNEPPRIERLFDIECILSLKICYSSLAKELIYKLMEPKNLQKIEIKLRTEV